MRELIELVSVYLALAAGFVALWYGVFSGGDLGACIVRALWCMLGALALGMAAKALWVLATLLAGSARRGGGKGAGEAAAEEVEAECLPPGENEGAG